MRRPDDSGPRLPTSAHYWACAVAALTFVLLSLTVTRAAQAQWVSPSGWHRFSLGAGPAGALGRVLPERRDGIAAMAAFELVAREHWEIRFSGTLFEGSGRTETQLGGAALDAVLVPFRGRVQPYAGAGVGVYQLTVEDGDPAAVDRRRDAKGPAWTAVAGARVRLGALTPFVEWRRTEFARDVPIARYAPLILGLHF
jgi:hypothetical protein